MPDGVMLWFDPRSGEARIVRGGREFAARSADVEPAARRGGAHVHFDIRRAGGVDTATEVRLRQGARSDPHHRRFGSLVGAHRPDTRGPAPFARPHPDYGLSLAGHPIAVIGAWARAVAEGDIDRALGLYAPDAEVVDGDETITGRRALHTLLETLPVRASHRDAAISGEGPDQVLARWERTSPDDTGIDVHSTLRHGQIVSQRFGALGPDATTVSVPTAGGRLVINVVATGLIESSAIDYARSRIGHLAEIVEEPILFARVKLAMAGDPARGRPAIAQAALDVNGHAVRAHIASHEMREAIDLLQARLRDKIEHSKQYREALRRHQPAAAEPGEWRHGSVVEHRPEYFDRPPDQREIVRHKSFTAEELTPDEAAFDMEQLDYDFHLFRDIASGEDSVLERAPAGTYRLHYAHGTKATQGSKASTPDVGFAAPVEVDPLPAPALTVAEATERLDAGQERFVFFIDRATDRGNVLYHRYDGHYGLITLE